MSDIKEALEGFTMFNNLKYKGCQSKPNATAVHRYWNHDPPTCWGGPPDYELKVQPLRFACDTCGAAPGWGCVVRHDRPRARKLKRSYTPLHFEPARSIGRRVGGVAVHGCRWKAACVEASQRLGVKRRRWATL